MIRVNDCACAFNVTLNHRVRAYDATRSRAVGTCCSSRAAESSFCNAQKSAAQFPIDHDVRQNSPQFNKLSTLIVPREGGRGGQSVITQIGAFRGPNSVATSRTREDTW